MPSGERELLFLGVLTPDYALESRGGVGDTFKKYLKTRRFRLNCCREGPGIQGVPQMILSAVRMENQR